MVLTTASPIETVVVTEAVGRVVFGCVAFGCVAFGVVALGSMPTWALIAVTVARTATMF